MLSQSRRDRMNSVKASCMCVSGCVERGGGGGGHLNGRGGKVGRTQINGSHKTKSG